MYTKPMSRGRFVRHRLFVLIRFAVYFSTLGVFWEDDRIDDYHSGEIGER
jgi:hypothetical protein